MTNESDNLPGNPGNKGSIASPETSLEPKGDLSVLDILSDDPDDQSYRGRLWVKCAIAMGAEIEKALLDRNNNASPGDVKARFVALFSMIAESCEVPLKDRTPLDRTINEFASAMREQAKDYCASAEWMEWEFNDYSQKVEEDLEAVHAAVEVDAREKIVEQAVGMYEMFEHWSNIDPARGQIPS